MAEQLTRRAFLERTSFAALGAAGAYSLLDEILAPPARGATLTGPLPLEQHLLEGLRVVVDAGVAVVIPPLHHQVVTARLTVGREQPALREARRALENALRSLELHYRPAPSGVAVLVAWGMPYFRSFMPAIGGRLAPSHLPVDHQASAAAGTTTYGFADATS